MSVQLLGNKWRNTTVEGRNLGWRKRGREVKTAAEIEVGKRERKKNVPQGKCVSSSFLWALNRARKESSSAAVSVVCCYRWMTTDLPNPLLIIPVSIIKNKLFPM